MNFYQYLNNKGLLHLLDGPDEKLDEVKRIYQKENRKEYKKRYQKQRVHRSIIFTDEEYELLLKASKNHKMGFSTFVREASLKYLTNGYIVPGKEQTHKVLVALKRQGTLVNQIAHQVNASKRVNPSQIQAVREIFNAQEAELNQIFTSPILIEDFVREVISKEPKYIEKIQSVLNSLNS